MATVTYVPEHTQSGTAMKRVIDYVEQDKKTLYEGEKMIAGKDCCPDVAFQEFMATKKQYSKAVGTFFYQYVQSFSPDECITPRQAQTTGLELAEYFKGYEVLVATHVDADHIHNHLVINSVSHETGLKLQVGPDSLFKLRKLSDEICLSHGLTVLPPYESGAKSLRTREYRAAVRGESWKFRLMSVIDESMAASHSKTEFVDSMASRGYQVNWTPSRKYITYTTPDGKKCRDNKLHEEKYLKEQMEGYFRGLTVAKGQEQAKTGGNRDSGRNPAEAIPADGLRHTAGAMGSYARHAVGHHEIEFGDSEFHQGASDAEFHSVLPKEGYYEPGQQPDTVGMRQLQSNARGNSGHAISHESGNVENGQQHEVGTGQDLGIIEQANGRDISASGRTIESAGLDARRQPPALDREWGRNFADSVGDYEGAGDSLKYAMPAKPANAEAKNPWIIHAQCSPARSKRRRGLFEDILNDEAKLDEARDEKPKQTQPEHKVQRKVRKPREADWGMER